MHTRPDRGATRARLAVALAAAGLLLGAGAWAQDADAERWFDNVRAGWEVVADRAESALQSGAAAAELEAMRPELERVLHDSRGLREEARARLEEVRGLLAALGPPPADGEPPERAEVATRRAQLQRRIASDDARVKQSELVARRVDQSLAKISRSRRLQLTDTLLRRGPSPLSPTILRQLGPHSAAVLRQLTEASRADWFPVLSDSVTRAQRGPGPLVALLVAAVLLWPLRRRLLRRCPRRAEDQQVGFPRRVATTIAVGLARGAIPALIAGAPLGWMVGSGVERGIAGDLVFAALAGTVFAILVTGLARATLAPYAPLPWRLPPLADGSARALYRRIRLLSALAAVLWALEYIARRHLEVPDGLAVLYDFVADSVVAALILSLLPARLWATVQRPAEGLPEPAEEPEERGNWLWLRALVATAGLAIPVAALAGYRDLATFIATNLLVTAAVAGIAVVVHGLARDLAMVALMRARDGEQDDRGARLLLFWLVAAVDLVLLIAATLALLRSWGIPGAELRGWLGDAIAGVRIGGVSFSLLGLLGAVAGFGVTLFATRAVQAFLERRVFPQTRLDTGVRHSLKTAVGYAGLTLATVVAVSALGLDLSNLAIIAGALSVGIGFGLQTVVNNFVSGLILLVERPLKVGDWVEVGAHQGYVKRINVRATEVQTFQRASVIIPNAELVSTAVVNWTHKDTWARVEVAVGVAYGCDTDRVREVLLACARDHPLANAWPSPYVLFMGFGDSSLDFELRLFINQANERLRVSSDLRFAIDRAFREHRIEIPFPQRDLHLRDLPPETSAPRRRWRRPRRGSPPR